MAKLINIATGATMTDIWVLDGNQSYHTTTIPDDLSQCLFYGLKKASGVITWRDLNAYFSNTIN